MQSYYFLLKQFVDEITPINGIKMAKKILINQNERAIFPYTSN
jgi:hypothetical protein